MMKKVWIPLVVLLSIGGNPLLAQRLVVEERKVKNEESNEVATWTARLDQDINYCMDTFTGFVKESLKTKTSKINKSSMVVEKIAIAEISNLRLDLRAIFTTETAGTSVSLAFSPGYDIHFGHDLYLAEFKKAESFVKDYVRYHYRHYDEQTKTVQDQIKSKRAEIESNSKKLDRNLKTIADNNKADGDADKLKIKNEKLVRENEQLTDDSARKREEITALEDTVSKLNKSLGRVAEFK